MPQIDEQITNCADCCAPPCYRRRVGNMFVMTETSRGDPIFVLGPCWAVAAGISVFAIAVSVSVYIEMLPAWDSPELWVAAVLVLLAFLACFWGTCCCDPGLFPPHPEAPEEGWIFSDQAQLYRPPNKNIKWCMEGQVLVEDYDHFCPWTGTVIAKKNQHCFHCFLLGVIVLIAFVMFLGMVPADGYGDDAAVADDDGGSDETR